MMHQITFQKFTVDAGWVGKNEAISKSENKWVNEKNSEVWYGNSHNDQKLLYSSNGICYVKSAWKICFSKD